MEHLQDQNSIVAVQKHPDEQLSAVISPVYHHHPPLDSHHYYPSSSSSIIPSQLKDDAVQDASAIVEADHLHRIRLTRNPSSGVYAPVLEDRFRNNLSFAVGFLELANAGDFAANIWNEVPIPVYASVLMALGGTFAGFLSIFAFSDARYAWRNVVFLRRQRAQLHETLKQRGHQVHPSHSRDTTTSSSRDVHVLLELNLRELGCEVINRFIMDILMGFGAILICVGTYMAMGGANRKVWFASNLLSGYVGNTPIAAYGLVNSAWAAYLAGKTEGHVRATARALPGSREYTLIRRRGKSLQLYCAVNGAVTLVGGVASLLTATRWWAYVLLIPVIILSITCNWFWRTRLGYSHDDMRQMPGMHPARLSTILCFAAEARAGLVRDPDAARADLVHQAATPTSALDLIETTGLLEAFCVVALADPHLRHALCGAADPESVDVSLADFSHLPDTLHPRLLEAAHDCLRSAGARRFAHLERFMAELLGIYLDQSKLSAEAESLQK